eukprot:753472-Hanusia_phi.AAC.4
MTQLIPELCTRPRENTNAGMPKDIVAWLERSVKDVTNCCLNRGLRRRPEWSKHSANIFASCKPTLAKHIDESEGAERSFADRRTKSCKLPTTKKNVRPNQRHSIGTVDGCKKYVINRSGPFLEASGQCDNICAIDEHGNIQLDGCLKLLAFQNRSPFRKAIDCDGNFTSNVVK